MARAARLVERKAALAAADRTADNLGNVRLALAGLTLLLVVLPLFTRDGWPWLALLPVGAVFVFLGIRHDRAAARQRRSRAAVRYYEQAIDRLEERWRSLPDDGAELGRELSGRAMFAEDLDLFGPASLFQLLSRATTAFGRRTLARWLVHPASRAELERRQVAVLELARRPELSEELVTSAAGEDASTLGDARLLAWAEQSPPIPGEKVLRILAIAQPVVLLAAALYTYFGGMKIVLVVAVVLHLVTLFATRGITSQRAEVLSGPDRALSRYASMIQAVEGFSVESPLLRELAGRLAGGPASSSGAPTRSASAQIRALHSIVELLDARLNMFFALSIGPATLWDLNLVLRAERFRVETGPHLRGWLEALGELEALSSLGAFAYERPDYRAPEVVSGPACFRALGLAHPLIDRRRVVPNDLELGGPGSVLLLSGSNMSGKSTLLRAVGINVVLARAGSVVAASKLAVSSLTLASSVRIVDSLAAGTSHFYAELKRLKQIVDAAGEDREEPVLYLLDEVLHGTNSRERFIGAVSVVRWLSRRGAMGIVTTHDLALAALERELPGGLLVNAHFGDEISGGEIHFDYRLKPGPVSSTNALALMRAIGIDVELIGGGSS